MWIEVVWSVQLPVQRCYFKQFLLVGARSKMALCLQLTEGTDLDFLSIMNDIYHDHETGPGDRQHRIHNHNQANNQAKLS